MFTDSHNKNFNVLSFHILIIKNKEFVYDINNCKYVLEAGRLCCDRCLCFKYNDQISTRSLIILICIMIRFYLGGGGYRRRLKIVC